MKLSVFLGTVLTTCLLLVFTPATSYNLVCYFSGEAIYRPSQGKFGVSNIDAHLCTHINFAFAALTEDGALYIEDLWDTSTTDYHGFSKLRELKSKHPHLKILISLGGENEDSKNFSTVAADPVKRRKLAWEILALIVRYNFDGVDIYWQYPALGNNASAEDKDNFVEMLKAFRTMYEPRGLIVTAAVAGIVDIIESSYDVKNISEVVDMINIMSFDYHGAFDNFVGHVSPLHASAKDFANGRNSTYTVATSVEYWLYKEADPQKINMGIVTYGRTFTLQEETNTQLYAPVTGPGDEGLYTNIPGYLGYNEICEFYSGADSAYFWDDEQKVPHRVWKDQWAGFENEKSVQLKVDFALSHNLAGIVMRSLDTDDFVGRCGEKYPLINTIKNQLIQHENQKKIQV